MQWVVAKCPKVCISAHGIQVPSLLDSSSKVTLLWQSYFNKYICQKLNRQWMRRLTLTLYWDWQLPMMGKCQLGCTPNLILLFWAQSAKCGCVNHRRTKPGTWQGTPDKVTWICKVEFNLAVLKCVHSKKWDNRIWPFYMSQQSQSFTIFPIVCISLFWHMKEQKVGTTSEVMSQKNTLNKSPKTDV